MNMPQSTKNCWILIISFFTSYAHAQEKNTDINANLNNYKITKSYEDTVNFRTRNISSVQHYSTIKKANSNQQTKVFRGKTFYLDTHTEYLPDGRKLYERYNYEKTQRIEKYHYDAGLKHLRLYEVNENNKVFYYNWLFYDAKENLIEEFDYSADQKNNFNIQTYIKYNIEYLKNRTKIAVTEYDSDSIASPLQTYIFTPSSITKDLPQYQSHFQKFELFNGNYKPVETRGFIFDDRYVDFKYDSKGFIISEIWHKPEGVLENQTTYAYAPDYKERIEQLYHMKGTEKSLKTTRRYNQYDDLIFQQSVDYTGSPSSIDHFTYIYDQMGNWVERKTYDQPCEKGIPGKKVLISHEMRAIEYYQEGQSPRKFALPALPKQVTTAKRKIAERALTKFKETEEIE